jgi:hypothetical protein
MKAMARALGINRHWGLSGLLLTAAAAGCGGGRTTDPGGGPTQPLPQVTFLTLDLSTGAPNATVRIAAALGDVSPDIVSALESRLRVATWPGDVEVSATETITAVPSKVTQNGVPQPGYTLIDKQLDPAVDTSAWYAISLPATSTDFGVPADPLMFKFDGGARGARFSPAHSPVVASVLACAKAGGVVAVYTRYSEPVLKATGAMPVLAYGATPVSCDVGADSLTETQFICPTATSGQPFSLQIPDGVTAQASGAAMAAGTLDSAGMQTATTTDGCTVYKPLTAN